MSACFAVPVPARGLPLEVHLQAEEAHHLTADIFIALLIRSPPQASTANAARLKARRADGTIAAVVHPYDGQIRRDPMNINGRPECAAVLTAETIGVLH